MVKILTLLVYLTIYLDMKVETRENTTEKQHSTSFSDAKNSDFKLRRFGILGEWLIKSYLTQLENKEKIEMERKHNKILKEDANRRKIFEKHLLKFQGGSNFLKDFHTNLY